MADAILNRLEAVTTRLEALSASGGGAGGDDAKLSSESVERWNEYYNDSVQPYINFTKDKLGLADLAGLIEQSWKNIGALIAAAPGAKKPSNEDLDTFLKPLVDALAQVGTLQRKCSRETMQLYKAVEELLPVLTWVKLSVPTGHIGATYESVEYNIIRDKSLEKKVRQEWMKLTKELINNMSAYVKQFHRTGLEYKGKGSILAGGAGAAAPVAPPVASAPLPVPAAAPKKKVGGSSGGGGVPAFLGGIAGGAAGLRSVKDSEKTKYRKDRSGLVKMPAKKAAVSKWATKSQVVDKPAAQRLERGNWMIEYQKDGVECKVEGAEFNKDQMKQGVNIYKCGHAKIILPKGKVKNIVIDSCKKTIICIQGVVSTIEVVNCQSVIIVLMEEEFKFHDSEAKAKGDETKAKSVPYRSISVDKTNGCQILCDEQSKNCIELITSMISEVNIQVPGASEDADPIEMAVAEQFKTVVKYPVGADGKPDYTKKPQLVTESVKHG